MDGKVGKSPTHYAGAIRIRAIANQPAPGAPEVPLGVGLQVAVEPKLLLQSIVATRIDKAVDDTDQALVQQTGGDDEAEPPGVAGTAPIIRGPGGIMRMPMMGGPGQTTIQFKKGEKPSKALKELKGTITAQMLSEPQPMMTVDNILKAAGTTTKGKAGGSIKIVEATRGEEGEIKLQVELEPPPDVTPARGQGVSAVWAATPAIRLNPAVPVKAPAPPAEKPKAAAPENRKEAPAKTDDGKAKEEVKAKPAAPPAAPLPGIAAAPAAFAANARFPGNVFNGLSLVDEKGKSFPIIRVSATSQVLVAGRVETRYEITFEAAKDRSAPAKLVFSGSRPVTVDIPFTLKDVPLK
jgi:hypothetical protein